LHPGFDNMGSESSENRDAQAPRRPNLPVRAGGFDRLFDRQSLRVMTALAAAGVGVLLFLVGIWVVATATRSVGDLERAEYARLAAEARSRLDRAVTRDRARLMEAAFADNLYALAAKGPAPPDSFIRPSFIEWFQRQYGDRFIGLYDLSGNRLFVWSADLPSGFEQGIATNGFLRILDNREATAGPLRIGNALFWIAGAPILPTNYRDGSQPIRGYLVVAQPFNPSMVAPNGNRTARVEIAPMTPRKEAVAASVETLPGDSVRVVFALPDVFAQQNALAGLVGSRRDYQGAIAGIQRLLLAAALLALALSVGLWWTAHRWLVGPTVRTAVALAPVHQGQVPSLIGSVSPAREWTQLLGAINRLLSNGRVGHERFERLLGQARDGVWERDLTSGDWTVSSRFRDLAGSTPGEPVTPLAALERRVHPDDHDSLVAALSADAGQTKPFTLDFRLRERDREYGWYRIVASVGRDPAGLPARLSGRLAAIREEREAKAELERAAAEVGTRVRTGGRLVAGLAARLAEPQADVLALARRADLLGQALGGTLGTKREAVDLHPFLQAVAERAGGPVDLTILPNVADRVEGDARLLAEVLGILVERAARSGRVGLRAERLAEPGWIRFAVEDRSIPSPDAARVGLHDVLELGVPSGDGPALEIELLVVHYTVQALGGRVAVGRSDPGTRVSIDLPLPELAAPQQPTPPVTAELPEFAGAGDGPLALDRSVDAIAPPPRPSGPERSVEIVADATVVINLDETAPGPAPEPIAATLRAELEAGGTLAHQTASIALKDGPVRLRELTGAVRAGEPRSAANAALALCSMAELIGARKLTAACRALIDAVEIEFEDAEVHLAQVDHAWSEVRTALEPMVRSTAATRPSEPPIDPTTLDQLRASLAADGSGLGTQLVSLFLAEAPTRLDVVADALKNGNPAAVRAGANDLKGMCSLVGARPLAARCADVAEQAQQPSVAAAVDALNTEFGRVQRALEELLGARAGT